MNCPRKTFSTIRALDSERIRLRVRRPIQRKPSKLECYFRAVDTGESEPLFCSRHCVFPADTIWNCAPRRSLLGPEHTGLRRYRSLSTLNTYPRRGWPKDSLGSPIPDGTRFKDALENFIVLLFSKVRVSHTWTSQPCVLGQAEGGLRFAAPLLLVPTSNCSHQCPWVILTTSPRLLKEWDRGRHGRLDGSLVELSSPLPSSQPFRGSSSDLSAWLTPRHLVSNP